MSLISIVSIVVMILQVIFVASVILYSKKEKFIISKSTIFWFVPVFLFLFTLNFVVWISSLSKISITMVSNSLIAAIKSFAFEIDMDIIGHNLENNVLFAIAYYISYALAVFTTLGSAFVLIKEYVFNIFRVWLTKRKETDILVGYSKTSMEYALENKGKCIIWVNNPISSDEKRIIQQEKIPYIKMNLSIKSIGKLSKIVRYNFILFEGQENQYQSLINLFVDINKTYKNCHLYLEVKYQEMNVVREQYLKEFKDNPNLYIKTFSKYELISRKFVTEFTIPKILNLEDFNENRSVKNEKKINVFFVGFGKINSSLFSMFCQNNQLVTMVDNKLRAKLVNYYMIDKNNDALDDNRIDNILTNFDKVSSDLPSPEPLCVYNKIVGNVKSNEVIEKVKSITSDSNSLNIFIVSFGGDFENIEMSSWIKDQLSDENAFIACRVKNMKIIDKKIIAFGNEKEILNHTFIVQEKLQKLAKDINREYYKDEQEENYYWNNLSQIELYSNYYAAMNLVFKLNMLGFDLTENANATSVSKEAFMKVYNNKTPVNHSYSDYFGTTARNVIAYGEKLRWNAFYLFNGYKPMKLDEVKVNSNKEYFRKDHKKKLHACLTSHEGLDQFHKCVVKKMMSQNISATIDDVETYKYDYMAFDNPQFNLFDSLLIQGYKIIKIEDY